MFSAKHTDVQWQWHRTGRNSEAPFQSACFIIFRWQNHDGNKRYSSKNWTVVPDRCFRYPDLQRIFARIRDLPINKKIWSPTLSHTTCDLGSTLLPCSSGHWCERTEKMWSRFEAFGINRCLWCVLWLRYQSSAIFMATCRRENNQFEGYIYNNLLQLVFCDWSRFR